MIFLIIWLITIFIASVISISVPKTVHNADKVVHFVLYGLTSIFFYRYFIKASSINKSILLSILCASAYGGALELLQHFLPRRTFSFGDMAANAAGAVLGCLVYATIRHSAHER